MSYILEALKKSEQIRHRHKPQTTFSVQTISSSSANKPKYSLWKWVIVFGIIINSGVLFYWLFYQTREYKVTDNSPAIEPQPTSKSAAPLLPAAIENNDASDIQVTGSSNTPAISTETPKKENLNSPLKVVSEARPTSNTSTTSKTTASSPQVQSTLANTEHHVDATSPPPITIALHMYSEVPSNRLVQINDKALREGDEIEKGLKLIKITPEGVTLDYRGVRFDKKVATTQ